LTKDIWISLFALVVSIVALVISIGGPLQDRISPGDTVPLTPSSFVIINGISGFPSHHILIPLVFYNSWRVKSELITQPYLVLHKVGSNQTLTFTLAGEYPKISKEALEGGYDFESTFIIPPSSSSSHKLAFKIDNWWNPLSKYYKFKFIPGEKYDVDIGYMTWDGKSFHQHPEIHHLFNMSIRGTIANLSDEYRWDSFNLNPITGETW
jgi:hypothetical protein